MYVMMLIHVFVYVSPERPTRMSPVAQRIPCDFDVAPHGEGSEEEEIIRNLEGLSSGIPDYSIFDDVPHACQRHTVGVSKCVHRLLRRIIWELTCYDEHHAH